jgi:hypothetical protein
MTNPYNAKRNTEISSSKRGHNNLSHSLTFQEQCWILAALRLGRYHRQVVEFAFGVSQTTLSYINTCDKMNKPRYRNLAREWFDLGRDGFMARYDTEEFRDRMVEARIRWKQANDIPLIG